MKRRPLLLAVVLTLAAVACIAPFWWEIWLVVAYERKASGQVYYHEKRASWFPGDSLLLLDQVCPECPGRCRECHDYWQGPIGWKGKFIMQSMASIRRNPEYDGSQVVADAYCICPTCHPERGE